MRNKWNIKIILLSCSVLLISFGFIFISNKTSAFNLSRYKLLLEQTNGYEKRALEAGISNAKKLEIDKETNKDKKEQLKSVDQMKGYIKKEDLTDGAFNEKEELMTYEQFLNTYEGTDLDLSIDKDRMIWVIVTRYPNGFKHRLGFVSNAVITRYFDAETGDIYGYTIKSLDKGGNGISKKK